MQNIDFLKRMCILLPIVVILVTVIPLSSPFREKANKEKKYFTHVFIIPITVSLGRGWWRFSLHVNSYHFLILLVRHRRINELWLQSVSLIVFFLYYRSGSVVCHFRLGWSPLSSTFSTAPIFTPEILRDVLVLNMLSNNGFFLNYLVPVSSIAVYSKSYFSLTFFFSISNLYNNIIDIHRYTQCSCLQTRSLRRVNDNNQTSAHSKMNSSI